MQPLSHAISGMAEMSSWHARWPRSAKPATGVRVANFACQIITFPVGLLFHETAWVHKNGHRELHDLYEKSQNISGDVSRLLRVRCLQSEKWSGWQKGPQFEKNVPSSCQQADFDSRMTLKFTSSIFNMPMPAYFSLKIFESLTWPRAGSHIFGGLSRETSEVIRDLSRFCPK